MHTYYTVAKVFLKSNLNTLEIKPCELGSRIRDMEAEWRLRVILISFLGESLVSRTGAMG